MGRRLNKINVTGLTVECLLCFCFSTYRLVLSTDMLQMSDSGIWGNPLGFEEEAMQVQSILPPCERHETGNCEMSLPQLRLYSTNLVVKVFILLDAALTVISSNHTASLSVFSPQLLPFKQLPLRCLAK